MLLTIACSFVAIVLAREKILATGVLSYIPASLKYNIQQIGYISFTVKFTIQISTSEHSHIYEVVLCNNRIFVIIEFKHYHDNKIFIIVLS